MKNIGSYKGYPCYKCNESEWKSAWRDRKDDGSKIYILDSGVMIKNNIIIGKYDGHRVEDDFREKRYMIEDNHDVMNMRKKEEAVVVSSSVNETVKEICFADYSKVVDEFFKNL